MSLFNDPKELERKEKLRQLEDKRLRFAEQQQRSGFAPEKMIICSGERGGLYGLCREGGQVCLILGPDFGGEGEFVLERFDRLPARMEDYYEKPEGMGGFLGLGKRGQQGFRLIVERPEGELAIPYVYGLNCAAVYPLKKNPLLSVKRRRGDANVVWDLPPVDKHRVRELERLIREILG